jgi:hypothetical protein
MFKAHFKPEPGIGCEFVAAGFSRRKRARF